MKYAKRKSMAHKQEKQQSMKTVPKEGQKLDTDF